MESNPSSAAFEGRTFLVTGGSRGIGAAIVRQLCSCGAHVAFNYHSDVQAAQHLCNSLKQAGFPAPLAIHADLKKSEDVEHLFCEAEKHFGEIYGLVNNAGTDLQQLIQDVTDEEWNHVMQTNLRGTFYGCRRAVPSMIRKREGRIVNISSVYARTGAAFEAVYAASKGAVDSLTRSMAMEVASCGITVNAVAPGPILTDMLKKELPEEEIEELRQEIPVNRLGTPDDIASMCLFLLSPAASFITGQIIAVDGGWKL